MTKQRPAHPAGPVSKELTDPGTSETDGSQSISGGGGGQLVLNDSVRPQRTSLPSMQKQKTVHADTKSAARHAALCIDFHANQAATFTFQKVFRQLVVSGEFRKKIHKRKLLEPSMRCHHDNAESRSGSCYRHKRYLSSDSVSGPYQSSRRRFLSCKWMTFNQQSPVSERRDSHRGEVVTMVVVGRGEGEWGA